MTVKTLLFLLFSFFFFLFSFPIHAAPCYAAPDGSLICPPPTPPPSPDAIQGIFGKIQAPDPLKNFIGTDPTGAAGISRFLSNFVALFYGVAGIVLIFMLLWGAWGWMTSEGDKEKLESARKKIINAIVGIILFAVAFAIIQVLGQFTGFKFFEGQKP